MAKGRSELNLLSRPEVSVFGALRVGPLQIAKARVMVVDLGRLPALLEA